MKNKKTLYYDRNDVPEEIDNNKTSGAKEWFKFQSYVCNRCHDLLMISNES